MDFMVTGHRGAMALEPENTLRSFRRGAECGATEVELDLRATADGRLVVMHDATVDRTTNGTGAVAELSLAELQTLDAGAGERVPTFAQVVAGTELPLQVELKELAAVEPFLQFVRAHPSQAERMSPSSFAPEIVSLVSRAEPGLSSGLIVGDADVDVLRTAQECGARRLLLKWAVIDRDLVEVARTAGYHVGAWPVVTAKDLQRVADLGLHGLTTDDPRLVADAGFIVDGDTLKPAYPVIGLRWMG